MLWVGDVMDEELLCGAINPFSRKVQEYEQAIIEAEKLYRKIIASDDDYLAIADRAGYSVEQILTVKHYITMME